MAGVTPKRSAPIILSQSPVNHMMYRDAPVTFSMLKERLKASFSNGPVSGIERAPSPVRNPFITTPQSNPSFCPQNLGKKGAAGPRKPEPPKPPEKPMMPYSKYSRKVWDMIKGENPDLKLWEIGKIIGQMWRDLPRSEKEEYIKEYEIEKLEYEKSLEAYHNSPAYQSYLAAKQKPLQQTSAAKEPNDRSSGNNAEKSDEYRFCLEPAEDEEDYIDESFSVKQIAYSRYLRNHRLLCELFSDAIVPSSRPVVTTARVQILKRQAESLKIHQKKIETELQQMEEVFEMKKRKMEERRLLFEEEMRKVVEETDRSVEAWQKQLESQYFSTKPDKAPEVH